ncbi:MAG: glycosyltransferase family 4 protein [Bacteroidota bacterium]
MSDNKLHIVHLGISGFPIGFGGIQRLILLYKGLISAGASVTVINRKAFHDDNVSVKREGIFEGVSYVYTSLYVNKPKNFWVRRISDLVGSVREFKLLYQLKRKGKLDAGSVYITGLIWELWYYRIISRVIGFPIVLSYVEYRSAIQERKGKGWQSWGDTVFDRAASKYTDGILPISEYLMQVARQQSPKTPSLKVPVIQDFTRFNVPSTLNGHRKHFLYVGAATYTELILFVLKAFSLVKADMELHMVLGGHPRHLEKVYTFLEEHPKKELIKIFNNVSDEEIPRKMANASALLIPLRPTIQDEARFPHKVGEYVASGRPLITCNYGEIQHYFKDGDTALVAAAYDERLFADKMQYVSIHPKEAKAIGKRGKELGQRLFDYKAHGKALRNFIETLRS